MGNSSWTQEDVDRHNAKLGAKMPAHVPAPQKSKYRNVKIDVDGIRFDSKREAEHWAHLKLREHANEICELERQVKFELFAPIDGEAGMRIHVCDYYADYVYHDNIDHQNHVVDAKGKRTQMYALKKKWLELQSGIVIEEV